MVCLRFPGGSWMAALTVILMVLSPPLAWARNTQPHFLEYATSECHFSNGTQQVRFLDTGSWRRRKHWLGWVVRHIRRDTNSCWATWAALREACPRPELRTGDWRQKGSQPRRLTLSSSLIPSTFSLLVAPTVTVYPAKTQPLQHHNLLVCSVNGFYPGHIEVRWFRNGQEEEAGVVSTGLIRNGDWTFQTMVMLETVPRSGEVYTCQVEHPSLTSPITVEWRAQSESAQSKMLSGVGGFVLGLLFLGAGLFIHRRNQKGHTGLQPTGLLS
nr:PREDICTED: DLA class II histocompatibility antigen, DR-1 beta chain-like [Equus przewalskii]